MLLNLDIITEMIIWNKRSTEDINVIRTNLKKDKQEIQNIMNDLQEKLKVGKRIYQNKYKRVVLEKQEF